MASHSPTGTAVFFRVAGLVDPPQALMRPRLVRDVLRQSAAATPATTSAEVTVLPSGEGRAAAGGAAASDTVDKAA